MVRYKMRYSKDKGVWSRRDFLEAAAPALLAQLVPTRGLALASEANRRLAYVGSYTSAVDGGAMGREFINSKWIGATVRSAVENWLQRFPILPGSSFTLLKSISTQ